MNKQKKSSSFLEGGQIREADMMAYLRNELSAEQRQQFDQLLEADPFAQDALEGLQATENVVPVADKIAGIKERVRERTGAKKESKLVQMHWVNYAYAAVVFGVLVGVGFLVVRLVSNQNNELAMNKAEEVAEQPLFEAENGLQDTIVTDLTTTGAVAIDTLSGAAEKTEQQAQITRTENSAPALQKDAVAKTPVQVPTASTTAMNSTLVASDNEAGGAVAGAARGKAANADQVVEDLSVSSANYKSTDAKALMEVAVKKEAVKAAEKKTAPAPTVDDAMSHFNSADYKVASEKFDEVLKKDPNNAEALYFGGISDYLTGKSAKSEKSFDKLLKTNRYTEGSKWYKANILLKKGKKDEAAKLLQELSNAPGMYKERSVKKLEELQ